MKGPFKTVWKFASILLLSPKIDDSFVNEAIAASKGKTTSSEIVEGLGEEQLAFILDPKNNPFCAGGWAGVGPKWVPIKVVGEGLDVEMPISRAEAEWGNLSGRLVCLQLPGEVGAGSETKLAHKVFEQTACRAVAVMSQNSGLAVVAITADSDNRYKVGQCL